MHRDRAEEARELLDRALACDLFATSIANGVFGVLLLNPPYDYDSEDKRTEHAFLTHTTRYLADGGLLVFIVPKQRLSVSARYLASHYRDLHCWALSLPGAGSLRPGCPDRLPQDRTQPRPPGGRTGAGLGRGGTGGTVLRRLPGL